MAFSNTTCSRLLTALLLLLSLGARAQLQLTTSSSVTQNFDGLGSSATAALPPGFELTGGSAPVYGTGTTTATTQAGGTSGTGALTSTSSGGAYNFATGVTASSTDRALGFLSTGSYLSPRHVLLAVRNSAGQTLTDLEVAFDLEKYRTGTRAFDWQFYTSPDGTTWSGPVTAGSQSYAADGANAVVNPPTSLRKTVALTALNLADGGTFYLRWSYVGTGGSTNAQGLALDNLTLTPTLSGTPAPASITTGTITGSPFCVPAATGAAVSVPFTATGGLTGTFAAQLSDAAGTFPADLARDLIGTGTASPIAATLPAGTAAGTGYRIRVVHAASATTGSANTANLTITTPPATNAVTLAPTAAQGLTTTGTGAPITATATAASSFAWFYSTSSSGPFSTAIGGATAATYTPRGADFNGVGTYYLVAQATSTCGSVAGTSAPVTITVSTPSPTLTLAPNPVPDFGTVPVGQASASTPLSVSGTSLTAPVTLTPPAGFQLRTGSAAFSCAPLTLTPTGGTLTATVDVRFVPELAQAYRGPITVASADLPGQPGVEVSGTGVAPAYPPSVSTAAVSAVAGTTATAGGTVLDEGGRPVTARGIVYATTEAPTTQDDFTQDGTGAGSFVSALSGLLPNTTYYVRAYATNAKGTSYGEQLSFTTATVALAAEPTQASTLTATTVAPTTVTLALSGGNGTKQLVLVTQGPGLSFQPQDGTTYAANAAFGQGDQPAPGTYVVGAAGVPSLTVTGLLANTEYTFAVFDYNDNATSGAENYLLTPHGELTLTTPTPPAGLLLAEDFDYPAGDPLTAHGWTAHSSAGTSPILVSPAGLSAPGYAPASGNAASLVASGEDVNRPFLSQGAGTNVYAALLVRVNTASAADYFFHLGPDPLSTTFRARLFVKAAPTSGKVQFGVSGSGTATVYAPTEYDLNRTYLLVLRYVFGLSGTETRLYVNPGQAEPATADATSTEAASSAPANIGSVALRQGPSTSPLLVDGLRIATGYTQARPFSGPLPVTLTTFTARRQPAGSVQLQWATAQELNARLFRVQRSADGRLFAAVATQAAAGTTAQARQYATLDPTAPAGVLYYRLEQEDTDGTRHYSPVVTVAPGAGPAPAASLTVAPNPADPGQPLTLNLTGRAGQALTLQVLDNAGRLLHTQALHPATDQEPLPLALPATLSAGTYLLRVTGPGYPPLHTRLVLVR
ncbi:hypothetical protein [Hymenobacter antarcticus]|uniref:Fibronectin type-III domain-containing protein n=1 Tax=Hymenobacter antarcticus TaxID=486270 RepID=A0ABP7QMI9_9BACT